QGADEKVARVAFGWLMPVGAVVPVGDTDIDAGPAAFEGQRIDSSVLQGFPRRLQQQPLLRVESGRLPGTDPEEPGVELVHVMKEATAAHIGTARPLDVGVLERVEVPSAILWKGRD